MHISINRYLRILRKRWWLILLVTLVGAGTASYYTLQQESVYRSRVMLLLSPAGGGNDLLWFSPSRVAEDLAQTYGRYLQTSTFANLVIEREGLDISAAALQSAVRTQIIADTQFFEIIATANTPEMAFTLTTAIANNFIQEMLAQQQAEVMARRATGDVNNVSALLTEKLERERVYFEEQVVNLRSEIDRLREQPPSTTRDELLADVQSRLSADEEKLMQILSDQVALQPKVDDSQINTATIVEAATMPTAPINGPGISTFAYALAASLMLGVALAIGLEYLDYTVHSPEELEEVTGNVPLGVLATLGSDKRTKPSNDIDISDDLVVVTQPRSPMAEAFRALATDLRFSGAGRQLKSLVVTSAGPGEGKSLVAANLAAAFAQAGRSVILVDADMRRPTVYKRLNLPNSVGLSSLIIAENATDPAVMERFLQQGPAPSLRILTSGPIPPNPAELLSLPWAPDVFEALESQADLVIWDTPPALTVTDAVILAERVDATLQVVRAGHTRRDLIVKTREALTRVGANVLPPVLNRVRARDVGYYQYYYYRYGREGEGYSRREKEAPQQAGTSDPVAPKNGLEETTPAVNGGNAAEPTRKRRRSSNPLRR